MMLERHHLIKVKPKLVEPKGIPRMLPELPYINRGVAAGWLAGE